MKRKMDKTEKIRRQAWREQTQGTPSVAAARQKQVAKQDRRAAKEVAEDLQRPIPVYEAPKDPRSQLADVFKGTRYVGPHVRVTRKQAFEGRHAKRLAKIATELAMEDHEARMDALTTQIDAAELER